MKHFTVFKSSKPTQFYAYDLSFVSGGVLSGKGGSFLSEEISRKVSIEEGAFQGRGFSYGRGRDFPRLEGNFTKGREFLLGSRGGFEKDFPGEILRERESSREVFSLFKLSYYSEQSQPHPQYIIMPSAFPKK